jgi:CRP-like cAMP-binding protein
MDTSSFFTYDADATPVPHATALDLLPEDWTLLLATTDMLRFRPGDVVLRAGERDRALYLLLDGRLTVDPTGSAVSAPAVVGVTAFLDGLPHAETLRADSHGELARMSWDAYEALSARNARLGRAILLELARGLAARLRA